MVKLKKKYKKLKLILAVVFLLPQLNLMAEVGDVVSYNDASGTEVFSIDSSGNTNISGRADLSTYTLPSEDLSTLTMSGNGETITVNEVIETFDAGGTARTGVILSAPSGTTKGFVTYLVNVGGETITFDTATTVSNVITSNNASKDAIPSLGVVQLVWVEGNSAWFPLQGLE